MKTPVSLILALMAVVAAPVWAADQPDLLDQKPGELLDNKAGDLLDQKSNDDAFNQGLPKLFPDKKKTDASVTNNTPTAEQKMMQRMQNIQFDAQMRTQMQQVSSWLTEYSMRNYGNFPGVETGDSWGARRNATLQLTELVGSNPYGNSANQAAPDAELNGLGPGLAAYYHGDGTPVTGSPTWDDEWTSELGAQSAGRVNLVMDYGLTPLQVDNWRSDPPSNWTAAPGCITAIGNNHGLLAIWGAGSDGKPVTDTSGKGAFIVSQQVMSTVGDQNNVNEDQ